jgi:hypothetical protein
MIIRLINILLYELLAHDYIIDNKKKELENVDIILGQMKDYINICLSAFVFQFVMFKMKKIEI